MKSLKNALLVLIVLSEKTSESLEDDGVIDWMEGTSIGISALGLIKIFKDFPNIVAEFKALTDQQKAELAKWFKDEFDLANDNIEVIVEEIFKQLIQMSSLFDVLATLKRN